ncbi:hypothetical protein ACJJTC_019822 [Scirpophaga incertulas]
MCDNNNPSTQSIADYLAQLLKDRKQLAAFPNVFMHMERLLDEDHKSDASTNATTHSILSLFLSSPAELWSSDVCNAILEKRSKAERLSDYKLRLAVVRLSPMEEIGEMVTVNWFKCSHFAVTKCK